MFIGVADMSIFSEYGMADKSIYRLYIYRLIGGYVEWRICLLIDLYI